MKTTESGIVGYPKCDLTSMPEFFPGLLRIKLTMPNTHYLNIDLTKVGRPAGQKKVFLPTSDLFGCIEAVVAR